MDVETIVHWTLVFGVLCAASWAWLQIGLFVLIADALMTVCGSCFALMIVQGHGTLFSMLVTLAVGGLVLAIHNLLVIQGKLDEITIGIGVNLISIGGTKALVYESIGSLSIIFTPAQMVALSGFESILMSVVVPAAAFALYVVRYSGLAPRISAIKEIGFAAEEVGVRISGTKWLVATLSGFLVSLDAVLRVTITKSISVDQWIDNMGFLALGIAFFARRNVLWLIILSIFYSVPQALSTQENFRALLGLHIATFLPLGTVLLVMFGFGLWRRQSPTVNRAIFRQLQRLSRTA